MNLSLFDKLPLLIISMVALGLAACASAPKELSLADQIRARGQTRVDVAKSLDDGEAKITKGQKMAKKAADLEANAVKREKRAATLTKDAKSMRQESVRLKQESDRLSAEGAAQVDQAVKTYQSLKEQPTILLPEPAAASEM